jgi:hypothetical protein
MLSILQAVDELTRQHVRYMLMITFRAFGTPSKSKCALGSSTSLTGSPAFLRSFFPLPRALSGVLPVLARRLPTCGSFFLRLGSLV